MNRRDLRVPSPCTADWSQMTGDDQRRFCDLCQKHVHDLSALTEPQARTLLDRRDREAGLCIRYAARPSGEVRFQPPRRPRVWRGAALVAALALSSPSAEAALAGSRGTQGGEQTSQDSPTRQGPLRRLRSRVWRWLRPEVVATSPEDCEPLMGNIAESEPAPEPEPEAATETEAETEEYWTAGLYIDEDGGE